MKFFSFKKFAKSISFALRGFKCVFREQNFKIQIICAIIVVFLIFFLQVKVWEAVALIMMTTLVLVLEIINSIFERIVDILEPRVHPYAKNIKDMMAFAVFMASVGAASVGIIILWPYLESIMKAF